MKKAAYLLSLTLVIIVFNRECLAHPYFPLKKGQVSKSDYSFFVDTKRKEFEQTKTNGSMTCTAEGWKERSGKQYLAYRTTYKDIPYMKEDAQLWRREEDGAIYVAQENKDVFTETIELPAKTDVGTQWEYNDGVKSIRTITAHTEVTIATGEKLNDCLEVTRKIIDNEALKNFSDRSYYCRGRGDVRTLITQPSPVGDYRTETIQRSYVAGTE